VFLSSFIFFFQAEDGIRDFHVTGVQTCALPISVSFHREIDRLKGLTDTNQLAASRLSSTQVVLQQLTEDSNKLTQAFTTAMSGEIGRASCRKRERSEVSAVGIVMGIVRTT